MDGSGFVLSFFSPPLEKEEQILILTIQHLFYYFLSNCLVFILLCITIQYASATQSSGSSCYSRQ